jgi:hypothetical protein
MRMRGVVFGSRSSGDPVRQITATAPFRRSITSPVQEVMRRKARSNFQWFKRCRSQPFNGSIVQQFKGRSHGWNFTSEDSPKRRRTDRLEVQLASQA